MNSHEMSGEPGSKEKTVALVLQGGGAPGSYHAGVFEALAAADNAPKWVAGISIGAINAAIIAGNPPVNRAEGGKQTERRDARASRRSGAGASCEITKAGVCARKARELVHDSDRKCFDTSCAVTNCEYEQQALQSGPNV